MAAISSEAKSNRRRRSRRVHERSRIALFDVFRHSFEERDDLEGRRSSEYDRTSDVPQSVARREGVSEDVLRAHVRSHLEVLMNTVRLDAIEDLEEYPHIKRSVLNYGFQDMSNLTRRELLDKKVSQSIRQSLRDHEPRLVKGSVDVQVDLVNVSETQRLALQVMAELIADPADIPVDYQADIDSGSGKVTMQDQRRPGK